MGMLVRRARAKGAICPQLLQGPHQRVFKNFRRFPDRAQPQLAFYDSATNRARDPMRSLGYRASTLENFASGFDMSPVAA
jgi:hypothetical protein